MRIGFIGAGLNAHGHAIALRSIIESSALGEATAELAQVYDIDSQKTAVFADQHGVTAVATEAEEMFKNRRLDAVYICTPTSSHKDYFLKAAEAGKHIFVEKPLAFTTVDIREMITAREKAGIKAQVGLVLRFEPVFWFIKQLIEKERENFGSPLSFSIRSDQEWPLCGSFHDSSWRSDPDEAFAGCLFEHSIHDVDLIRYLFGKVNDLSAFIGYRSP
ncbi:MAG TPA: Gfo/Idh/MocA family oxidoreductase, partial [Candidatus Limnocylindrales bacterium]|nr:Gfo/Idh/MocA family oxidoreductase [Candidatus Limnocylindrales bacterium]